jgi:hypothetical protein
MCGHGSVEPPRPEPRLTGYVADTDDAIDDYLRFEAAESDGWQDFLVRLAHGVRQIALDHPDLFPLAAARPADAARLHPPLRSLRWTETFLDIMLSYGFDDDAAVSAYRSYTAFLLGQLLVEVSALRPVSVPESQSGDGDDLASYPHLRRLRPMLSQDHGLAEFDDALEALLDRLEQLLHHR